MSETAIHLVDRVLPAEPIRQWVLSFPFQLRLLLAIRPMIMAAALRITHECIAELLRKKTGLEKPQAQTGAVTLIQRFGGSINLNVHFHQLFIDGAYEIDGDAAEFHPAAPPLVVPAAQPPPSEPSVEAGATTVSPAAEPPSPARISWARLLKRVFGIDVETCSECGGKTKIVAAIEDPPVIRKILGHLGLPTRPPPIRPADRGPPLRSAFDDELTQSSSFVSTATGAVAGIVRDWQVVSNAFGTSRQPKFLA